MILEAALLDVKKGLEADFEASFTEAINIISIQPGFISLELQKCIEIENRYLLLVNWEKIEQHTEDFKNQKLISNGKRCCIIFTSLFPLLSITV